MHYITLELQTVLTKCECHASKHNFIPAHCLRSQHFFLMPLLVDHNIDHSSLSSSLSLFNKKQFCPLTNFMLNFMCRCCLYMFYTFVCAAVTIPQLHEYIKNKLKPTHVYTSLMYASNISLSHRPI
jgi:hypothetical protein